jgi:general secretion pathway protein G
MAKMSGRLAGVRVARSARSARGFTLVELLLVLVILGVLAAVVIPKFTGRTEQAQIAAARTDIATLETALDVFEVDCGRYPTTEEGLAALITPPMGLQNQWRGPYIKRGVPNDPWGNPYIYRAPGMHNTSGYDLYSMGPDGREGNDDITNWSQP